MVILQRQVRATASLHQLFGVQHLTAGSMYFLQLVKLVEAFENYMIADIRKLLVRQIDLVIKERNREEGNLPLDLWKRPVSRDNLFTRENGALSHYSTLCHTKNNLM